MNADSISDQIFKAYDVRGIYPTELNEITAEKISQAFAHLLQIENPGKQLTVIVGCDMRLSSPALKERVVTGLTTAGVNVVDIGLVSTPTFYFAVAFHGYDGGLQISASHNPKAYNGLKMVRSGARPIGRDTGMAEIKEFVLSGQTIASATLGQSKTVTNLVAKAVTEQRRGIPIETIKPMKIVVDAANAMGALDVQAMFTGLPIELIQLNFELDGNFPAHQPDPLDEDNLRILQAAVREHHADLGIAPDGDGDRYFFIDEQGEPIRQEILRGIMAQIALKEYPGATVCYDIRPGRITRDMIEAVGGRAVVTPVGHSLIKTVMLNENAVFGGESSGHYFYQFPYGTFEAPIILVTKLLVYLSEQNKPVSEIIKPYQKYAHSGEINSHVVSVPVVLERIKQRYHDGQLDLMDGVTVTYENWWFNVRGSNTEPLIRLNLEATSKDLMERQRDEVLQVIREP